jgi:hypothetical protein
MSPYHFYTLDVFTDTRFGGNPLAVVLDADALSGELMQTIAAEFNLSETVFVLKPVKAVRIARDCASLRREPSCRLPDIRRWCQLPACQTRSCRT